MSDDGTERLIRGVVTALLLSALIVIVVVGLIMFVRHFL